MGHWVTLDDDQHVYISDGGKVLATRGQISSASGGKERGRALAQRSRAAVGKATGRTARAVEHARAAGPSLREQAERARAAKGQTEHERHRSAQKLVAARHVVAAGPKPVKGVSDKQRKYATSVRQQKIEGLDYKKAMRGPTKEKGTKQAETVARAHVYKARSAKMILNGLDPYKELKFGWTFRKKA